MWFLAFAAVALAGGRADAGTLRSVLVSATANGASLKISVPGGLNSLSSFMLTGPDRIVIDMSGISAGMSSASGGYGVAKVRAAQFNEATTRLVIDLERPMMIANAGVSAGRDDVVLTLRNATAADFLQQAKAPRKNLLTATPSPAKAPPPKPAEPAPPVATPAPPPPLPAVRRIEPKPSRNARGVRPLVVIDAGHGGHDTGALSVYDGRREKDVTLAIAKAIARSLEQSGRVRVALTRSDDRFLVLGERVEVARRQKADLFISIHADSAPNADARGATVYTLSEVASDKEAARLAAKENKSDIINGVDLGKEASDVSSILIDLARRDTMNVSSSFAALLQRELAPYVKFKTQFHRFAGFRVLKAADTPSVLLETGYLSNMDDSRFLFSDSGQKALATGVKNAIEAHFARRLSR